MKHQHPGVPQDDFSSSDCLPPVPPVGAIVDTACGGTIPYIGGMPCVVVNGRPVFFCLAICKADFDRDPRNSCMAVGPFRYLR